MIKRRIDEIYFEWPFYGSRRIAAVLRWEGCPVNRKAVQHHRQELEITGICPGPNLSRRNRQRQVFPYLLRGLHIAAANQVWGIDITCIRMPRAWMCNATCEVICNKVIVQGEIHKQIFFVGPDDLVHHQAEDIPFIDLPGAEPGQSCQVHGSVEHISWHLCDPVAGGTSTALADPYVEDFDCPTFARLLQKTVVDVCVSVAEDRQVHVRTVPVQAVQCRTICQ